MTAPDDQLKNPYQPTQCEAATSHADQKARGLNRKNRRDRALLLAIVLSGVLAVSNYFFGDFVHLSHGDPETKFAVFAYSFIAVIVSILVIYRDKDQPNRTENKGCETTVLMTRHAGLRANLKKMREQRRSAAMFFVCVVTFGICSWMLLVPDPRDDQEALYFGWLVASAMIGFAGFLVLQGGAKGRAKRVFLLANSSVAMVVIGRVVIDSFDNSTSHNLWPFEVIIACIVVTCGAGTGALAAAVSVAFTRIVEGGNSAEH